jgi:glycosyltransferase involved in cell wall biosynthesis
VAKYFPKKIAVLLPSLKFGGAERVALNLANAFKDLGIQVDVLLMSCEGEFLEEARKAFNVVDLSCNRTYKLPARLIAYLRRQRPNVLLSSFWKLNLCSCIAKMLFPRIKLLLWEHSAPSQSANSPKWLYAISASVFYRFANTIVAVSTGVFEDVAHWTIGLRRQLIVIFNPIPPPDPNVLTARKAAAIKRVIWVGRLDIPKNPGLVLEAFALVPATCFAELIYVGDGRLRPALEQQSEALGLDGRVRFLGFLPNPYVEMAASDLLVVSSDREGLGNVIIEAMHCGLRVVCTDCGKGIHDILLDNKYGTIVPLHDRVALAKAIERELESQHSPQDQMDGALRFLPNVVAHQFLLAMG